MGMAVLVLWLVALGGLPGYGLATELLTPAEARTRVKLTQIADFSKMPLPVCTPRLCVVEDQIYAVRGKDREGKPWHVKLPDAVRAGWRGTGSEADSYYFHGYTGGVGFAPPTWILALSFDENGRPVPFYFFTQGGMEDLVNLDGTGPQLLQQDYWGGMHQDPGYYVTTLYEKRGPYWYRSDGRHGEHEFPAFEKWSLRWESRTAVLVSRPESKESVHDFSNDPAGGVSTSVVVQGSHRNFAVGRETGCASVHIEVAVVDSATGRRIFMPPLNDSIFRHPKARHILTGVLRSTYDRHCTASVVWSLQDRKN